MAFKHVALFVPQTLDTNEITFVRVFQMAFLQNRSISLVDMYIDNSEPSENVGQIHFSLEYDFQNTTLVLKIMQVRIAYTLNLGECSQVNKSSMFFDVALIFISSLLEIT